MNNFVRGIAVVTALIACFSAMGDESSNEFFMFKDVTSPQTISKSECEAKRNAVFVEVKWTSKGFFGGPKENEAAGCIRYFPSTDAEGAKTAVFFLHGDVINDPRTDQDSYEQSSNLKAQMAMADRIAKTIGVPVIRVGRPGVYGSTGMGHSTDRRMPVETFLVNAAISAIKEKLNYSRIQLAGQSGGGGLVAAVLTQGRTDVDCAVAGSGAISIKTRLRTFNPKNYERGVDMTGNSLSDIYDPIDHVTGMRPDQSRRFFILGDPQDQIVSFESQKEFWEKVSKYEPATLLTAKAGGKSRHNVTNWSQYVVGWCKMGLSNDEIQKRLDANGGF